MLLSFLSIFLYLLLVSVACAVPTQSQEAALEELANKYTKRTAGGIHLPILKREARGLERRGVGSAIGLGDYVDISYSVLLTIGGITTSLILDTGSSDLWVMSDACTTGCTGGGRVYPQASFKYSGVDVALLYGDSTTGTYADGKIGDDTISLAGVTLQNQYFSAINKTNTSLVETGSAGIFGLGFPINSVIWNNLFVAQSHQTGNPKRRDVLKSSPLTKLGIKLGSPFPNLSKLNLWMPKFPDVPSLLGKVSPGVISRQTTTMTVSSGVYTIFSSYSTYGPFVPRLVTQSGLTSPMFSVTLQRDTIDVGGAVGQLSIGELPSGVTSNKLTWVPLRLYTTSEGGLPAPPNSPEEVYPITWEIMLDGVYFDGEMLPNSTVSPPTNGLSALVDTGNSLIRGPSDLISLIQSKLGPKGQFSCSQPHTLAFKIGGVLFPVDPRDFVTQALVNDVKTCEANLAATDAPQAGGYQFQWSVGTPFLKSVLSAFYYGNLTYPTHDPPKMGFLSTVPSDASDKMIAAVAAAAKANNNFPAVSQPPPSGTFTSLQTDSNGLPQATTSSTGTQRTSSGARRVDPKALGSLSYTCASWMHVVLACSLMSLWIWWL
ncbi:aspartic peptidase domain-containing protein [Gymnopilus junonius]|uniref:Aspartic peptidase domain-containing protein n=1 Tax=Gymnopilus junonius TaxID=109634 RepID=A0A9P5TIM8_GYMJU|nr:aspartic peptidase domain-containing protein [Gymnopilus junonius]